MKRRQVAATLCTKRLAFAARRSSIAPPCLIGLMQIDGTYGQQWKDQLPEPKENPVSMGGFLEAVPRGM